MALTEAFKSLPEGDVTIDVEHVFGGWVAYVWLYPTHGPMVPTNRKGLYARTRKQPTRGEAFAALPEAFDRIKDQTNG